MRSRLASIRERFGGKSRRGVKPRKHRSLTVDTLEERVLLTVSPADWDDVLVNEITTTEAQGTVHANSVAVDHDGDFVVAWTRYDEVFQTDQNGDPVLDPITGDPVPVIDPDTGEPMLDGNVYARYFTDEVQRITLPEAIVADGDGNGIGGSFSVIYGGNEVQKISLTATNEPWGYYYYGASIAGTVTLGFDVNKNGFIGPGETVTVFFDEGTQEFTEIAAEFETGLQGLGGALADVTVRGVNPHEYLIEFGDLSLGEDQPQISVESISFTSGFLPALMVTTVREPFEIGPIPVAAPDPFDPYGPAHQTANAIEQYFLLTTDDFIMGPVHFPPDEDPLIYPRIEDPWPETKRDYPEWIRTAVPGVSVNPVWQLDPSDGVVKPSTTQFEITFDGGRVPHEGTSGKKDHPELVVSAVADENGTSLLLSPELDVSTIKEPSPEFRVNPPEPDNPFTPLPDRYDQTRPDVALDADGEFVIAWEGEVPDTVEFGTVSDVFARRFAPMGIVPSGQERYHVDTDFDGVADTPIQGVRLLVGESIQTMTFVANVAAPLVGDFELSVGTNVIGEISFDSEDVEAVALEMQTELDDAGYRDATVMVAYETHPRYVLEVTFPAGTFGPEEQLADIAISAVPVALNATISVDPGDPTTIQANTTTTGPQGMPAVDMDDDGNFVIAWGSGTEGLEYEYPGQFLSYFNGIRAQRYHRDGTPLGDEFAVNNELTMIHLDPDVALSPDGKTVIAWATTDDENMLMWPWTGLGVNVNYRAYESDGTAVTPVLSAPGAWAPAVDFDGADNFVISWDENADSDNVNWNSEGVRAIMYEFPAPGSTTPRVVRDEFRVNSSHFDPSRAENTIWPGTQWLAQPALDADGDLTICYQGTGPEVSEDTNWYGTPDQHTYDVYRQALIDRFYRPENADLLPYFDPMVEQFPLNYSGFTYYYDASGLVILDSSNEIDTDIENILIRAMTDISNPTPASDLQLGRIRALLDEVAGLLRGESDGVMYSSYDTDPDVGPLNLLYSDSVANNHRDGRNTRYILTIPTTSTGGTFEVRLYGQYGPGVNVTINPVYTNNALNLGRTLEEIRDKLTNADPTGMYYRPNPTNLPARFEGPVVVRLVSQGFGFVDSEITARTGTPWDYDNGEYFFPDAVTELADHAVYEITFQGEVHDSYVGLYLRRNQLAPDGTPPPIIFEAMYGDEGTTQDEPSIAMERDGDYVMVWTQHEEYTWGGVSNQNIYYRRFDENTDTAGPMVAGLSAAGGQPVAEGGQLNTAVTHLVLTFDEEPMMLGPDSALNPENYRLLRSGIEIEDGIAHVQVGLNMAARLAGHIDPLTGTPYDVSALPTNKWEAVITVDGNGAEPDVTPLMVGLYTIEALTPILPTATTPGQSGLRDKVGNALGHSGYTPGGSDYTRNFVITATPKPPGPPGLPDYLIANPGRTYPESAQAVAVDADGDHVVVWTSPVTFLGKDHVYFQIFDADGNPASTEPGALPVTPFVNDPSDPNWFFNSSDQRYATVAADKDGDFIVTWTNDFDGDSDIYARRYSANGTPLGDAFLVNSFGAEGSASETDQKWSHVAANLDGEFVITWSSFGQEDNGQGGYGYGVYARRYDSLIHYDDGGKPLGPQPLGQEFQVNVTTPGDQQFPTVDMDAEGGFVIAWTSDQSGVGDDVIARVYNPDGSPAVGPLSGEILVNVTTAGHQRYPNVATDLDGERFVITWSSSAQDGDGWGVYARGFTRTAGPATGELPVNTTTTGDQLFSSVAINHLGDALSPQGDFTVTWSGYGQIPGEEDPSGFGIFAQRFQWDGTPEDGALAEKRINNITEGNQWLPSIDSDGEGNFVVVWTGPGIHIGQTGVYKFVSAIRPVRWPVFDTDGPIVTDVIDPTDLSRLFQGDVLVPTGAGIQQLAFVFGERLSVVDEEIGFNSVLNPDNWTLERDGSQIIGGVASITFGHSLLGPTRKWEALITLDGNGLDSGIVPLSEGDYVLTVRDLVTDGLNALDGDYDGIRGTDPVVTGAPGFPFHFIVGDMPGELRVNSPDTTTYEQRFSAAVGTGSAREVSTRSVAVDHDGDLVVVWTSYGQDEESESSGAGVYYKVYDRNLNVLLPETRVNTTTAGDQRKAAVAMDADGDFVIVWEAQDASGSWEIYGRRYDSMGRPLISDTDGNGQIDAGDDDGEFRVNTTVTGHQLNPAVAMDDFGNFVVVWAMAGQDFSFFNDVYGQRYGMFGERLGDEFLVNDVNQPGVGNYEVNPTVAMTGPTGEFAVAWDVVTAQQNGVITDSVINAKQFDASGVALGPEFPADTGVGSGGGDTFRIARNPQLAANDEGGYILVWEAYMGNAIDGYDVYYNTFGPGLPTGSGQLNMSNPGTADALAFDQVNPSVAVDADGDFGVVWNGQGVHPDPLNPGNPNLWGDADDEGVFLRWFNASSAPVDVQSRVNRTENGIQHFPTLAMEPDGDAIVVWCGRGVGDTMGIFARRYDQPTDTAGPLVTELRDSLYGDLLAAGSTVHYNPQTLKVIFDEEMLANTSSDSVENVANWTVLDGSGVEIPSLVAQVDFYLDPATNKWTAELTFDGNGAQPGVAPLPNGHYTLLVHGNMQDVVGNPLALTGYTYPGIDALVIPFRVDNFGWDPPDPGDLDQLVNFTYDLTQDQPAVARAANGSYVVVWTSEVQDDDGAGGTIVHTDILAQQFDPWGFPIRGEFTVNTVIDPLTDGDQHSPDVAIDDNGNFVVVWAGMGDALGDFDGIFAQRFNAEGEKVGSQTRVNRHVQYEQKYPQVAMDPDGDYVVTWTSYGDGDVDGVMARRFNSLGQALDSEEWVANTTWMNRQDHSDVAMDAQGNFVIVWAANQHALDGSEWGVVGQRFSNTGARRGGEFLVNSYKLDDQLDPHVAMDDAGNFVVTWASMIQDGSSWGVYGRRFNAAATPQGNAFRVNRTTLYYQYQPDVSMDADGRFVITWTSAAQDNNPPSLDKGIYARLYNSDGTTSANECRVNAIVEGDQTDSAVSMDASGNMTIVWVGPDLDSTGIYSRIIAPWSYPDPPVDTLVIEGTPGNDLFELVAGSTAANSVVRLNGSARAVPPGTTTIRFDGWGGKDRVIFIGSSASETVELSPGYGTFSAEGYTVSVVNVEDIEAHGGGGNDVAHLRDDPDGVDIAKMRPNYGRLYGDGFDNEVSDFRSVHAYGSDGSDDVAYLYDDPQAADTFEATPQMAVFSNSTFFSQAKNFRYMHGYATEGGGDLAILRDNPEGKDTLEASPKQVRLIGSGYNARVRSFATVQAYATAGHGDAAVLYDDPLGKDVFKAAPDQAYMRGDGFYNRTYSFDLVRAYATAANGDAAYLVGESGQADTFRATPEKAELYGAGFRNEANSFDYAHGYGNDGDKDVAYLFGVAGQADLLKAWPGQMVYSGAGFYNRARSFDYAHGYANEGDGDWAKLYDQPGTADVFQSWPEMARLRGAGFYNRVKSFDHVTAEATKGDKDVAYLRDDPDTTDRFEAWPETARLYGAGFYSRVKSFDYVHAYATPGGKDVALLYDDAATADMFEAWPQMARLYHKEGPGSYSFYNRALSFRYVYATATPGSSDVAVLHDSPGKDNLFASPKLAKLYNGTFFNQAKSFRNTYVYSTSGGNDTAYLYDSDFEEYPDHFAAGADWARLSNELLGYAHWLSEFEEVTVTLSNESDTYDFVPELIDFVLTMRDGS